MSLSNCTIWYRHYILSMSGRVWRLSVPESPWRRVSLSQQPRNFTNLKAWFYSILKISSYSLVYSSIRFSYFRSIEEHLNVLSEYLSSTALCIQPVRELLGASGRIVVAVQNCWVVELWLPNHFTFCWCRSLCMVSIAGDCRLVLLTQLIALFKAVFA